MEEWWILANAVSYKDSLVWCGVCSFVLHCFYLFVPMSFTKSCAAHFDSVPPVRAFLSDISEVLLVFLSSSYAACFFFSLPTLQINIPLRIIKVNELTTSHVLPCKNHIRSKVVYCQFLFSQFLLSYYSKTLDSPTKYVKDILSAHDTSSMKLLWSSYQMSTPVSSWKT